MAKVNHGWVKQKPKSMAFSLPAENYNLSLNVVVWEKKKVGPYYS